MNSMIDHDVIKSQHYFFQAGDLLFGQQVIIFWQLHTLLVKVPANCYVANKTKKTAAETVTVTYGNHNTVRNNKYKLSFCIQALRHLLS